MSNRFHEFIFSLLIRAKEVLISGNWWMIQYMSELRIQYLFDKSNDLRR